MRMEAGLDTGPILTMRATDIGAGDTAQTLHDRLAALGAELICETLEAIDRGRVVALPQPLEGVTYADKINKTEARIDWRQDAMQVWRCVRAFNPWPVAETRLSGIQVRIWEADLGVPLGVALPGTVLAATQEGIEVACGRGTLRILRLQLAGRKPLSAREFLQGQPLESARFT